MLLPLAVRNNNTNNTHLILVNGAVLTSSTSAIDGQLEARSRGILISGQPFSAPYYICGAGEMSEPVGERRPGSHTAVGMCRFHGSHSIVLCRDHGSHTVAMCRYDVIQPSPCAVITGHTSVVMCRYHGSQPSPCAVITGHPAVVMCRHQQLILRGASWVVVLDTVTPRLLYLGVPQPQDNDVPKVPFILT